MSIDYIETCFCIFSFWGGSFFYRFPRKFVFRRTVFFPFPPRKLSDRPRHAPCTVLDPTVFRGDPAHRGRLGVRCHTLPHRERRVLQLYSCFLRLLSVAVSGPCINTMYKCVQVCTLKLAPLHTPHTRALLHFEHGGVVWQMPSGC